MKTNVVVFVLLVASIAAAQDSGSSQKSQPLADQVNSTLSPNQAVITNQDVTDMLKAGISPEIVAAKVKSSKCQCDTSPPALGKLKIAGVPDNVILAMVESAAPAVRVSLNPANISEARTACLVNRGTDLGMFDAVREKLQQWGRWKLVQRPEDADLLLVLSDQQIYAGTINTANASANTYGNHSTGSAVGISAPLLSDMVFLTAIDRASSQQVAVVSSARHHLVRPAASWLVARMRNQIEKHEKLEKSQAH